MYDWWNKWIVSQLSKLIHFSCHQHANDWRNHHESSHFRCCHHLLQNYPQKNCYSCHRIECSTSFDLQYPPENSVSNHIFFGISESTLQWSTCEQIGARKQNRDKKFLTSRELFFSLSHLRSSSLDAYAPRASFDSETFNVSGQRVMYIAHFLKFTYICQLTPLPAACCWTEEFYLMSKVSEPCAHMAIINICNSSSGQHFHGSRAVATRERLRHRLALLYLATFSVPPSLSRGDRSFSLYCHE